MIFLAAPGPIWFFVGPDPFTQRQIRASPTYADDARVGHVLHPGQVVVVDDRRMVWETQGFRRKIVRPTGFGREKQREFASYATLPNYWY